MSVAKLYDAAIFVAGSKLSTISNKVEVDFSAAMLNGTVFGNTSKVNQPGLFMWKLNATGFYDAGGSSDRKMFDRVGASEAVISVAQATAEGSRAYFVKAVQAQLSFLGKVGELPPFSLDSEPSAYGARGQVAFADSTRSGASGNGSVITLGATASDQHLVMGVHMTSVTGTPDSVVLTLKSAALVGFGSPTTRITSKTFTASDDWDWQALAGPITDTFYRVSWATVNGTAPTFTAFVVIGIV